MLASYGVNDVASLVFRDQFGCWGFLELWRIIEAWLGQPAAVVLQPTPRHAGVLRGLLETLGVAANLVNDAHLAALALEHGGEVVSFDSDFARFRGVRWRTPEVG